jgi:hypothetical protein
MEMLERATLRDFTKGTTGYHFTKRCVWDSNIRFEGLLAMTTPFIFFNAGFPSNQLVQRLALEVIIEVDIPLLY